MPAFDSAILIYTEHPDFDPAVAAAVQPEQYLAVTRCHPRIEQTRSAEIWLPEFEDWLTIYSPGRLFWDITAHVLQWNGLAHYHPGTSLARRGLTSENALFRMPFQRKSGGTLVYENPRLDGEAGGLPVLSFTIAEVLHGGLDTISYPGAGSTVSYFDLPAQAPAVFPLVTLTNLLKDVFQNTAHFDLGLVATAYDGDPAAAGVPILTPVNADAWDTGADGPPGSAITFTISSPAVSFDPDGITLSVSHFHYTRGNDTHCVDLPADPVVTLPAGHTLRIPAGNLSVALTWPLTGSETLPGAAVRPGSRGALHIMGSTIAAGILGAGTEMTVRCWNGEPANGGTENNSFTVPRNAATWPVTPGNVTNAALHGSDLADVDWTTDWVTVEITGLTDTWFIKQEIDPVITPMANAITIPAAALSLTLS